MKLDSLDQLLVLLAAGFLAGVAFANDYWLPGLVIGAAAVANAQRLLQQTRAGGGA